MTTASASPGKRLSRWWWLLVPAIATVALAATGTLKPPSKPVAKRESAVATAATFRVAVIASGTLEALQTRDIKPKVSGTVAQLPEVGMRFMRGQVIAKLDASTLARSSENSRLSLAKAQAQLESQRQSQANNRANQQQNLVSAQSNLENAQRDVTTAQNSLSYQQSLLAVGGASAQNVTDARNSLAKAEASLRSQQASLRNSQQNIEIKAKSDAQDLKNLELALLQAKISLKNAQEDLANSKIYAPFDGIVSQVQGQVGALATNGQALLTLIDDSKVKLPVQVDETQISLVKLGQSAEISSDSLSKLSKDKFTGKVTRISPNGTLQSNIAVFYATVTIDNANRQLRPGMNAEAEIIAEELPDAVQVPRRAVETVRERSYVTLVKGEDSERKRVEIGPDDGSNVVITSGVQPGDEVLLPSRKTSSQSSDSAGPPLP
jgi:HlyD family secretion protein